MENIDTSAIEFCDQFFYIQTSRRSINKGRGEGISELPSNEKGNRPGIVSWQTGFRSLGGCINIMGQ